MWKMGPKIYAGFAISNFGHLFLLVLFFVHVTERTHQQIFDIGFGWWTVDGTFGSIWSSY